MATIVYPWEINLTDEEFRIVVDLRKAIQLHIIDTKRRLPGVDTFDLYLETLCGKSGLSSGVILCIIADLRHDGWSVRILSTQSPIVQASMPHIEPL